jgi:iron donor protein CyaY
MIDEPEFRRRADASLEQLYRRLVEATGQHEFDVDMNAGALSVEFEDPPERFVVSPNAPVRQIWVSAHTKSFKLEWDPAKAEFVLPETRQSLMALMASAIATRLGEPVTL